MALAALHPLVPAAAVLGVLGWAAICLVVPKLWWTAVPALLPVLDASPWTGVLVYDEFDLLLLATAGAGWLRLAATAPSPGACRSSRGDPAIRVALALIGASTGVALVRGVVDAGGARFGLFQGYTDALNSVRVAKSLLYLLLVAPLVRHDLASDARGTLARLCTGVWIGMTLVAASVVSERLAFPGLIDFSQPYRTTATFWEMHVGGAAIDAYAALGAPFVAWAVWSARSAAGRLGAGLLALAWGYVCLTTFSRGVWLAVVLSLALLAVVLSVSRLQRRLRWQRAGDALLLVALLAEIGVVAATGSFMGERLTASDRDLSSRLGHWRNGLALLRTPADWIVGIGAGRLPARYAEATPHDEFSGSLRAVSAAAGAWPSFLRLAGPRRRESLGGLFAATQRVTLRRHTRYMVDLAVRAAVETELEVAVCEMRLLYFRRCQSRGVVVGATSGDAWAHVQLPLLGPSLDPGRWFAPRSGVLALSVANAGGVVDVTDIVLRADGDPAVLTRNARFADGLAGWFPLAQRNFVPWHIDNFVLETLIERGLSGLLTAATLVGLALVASLRIGIGGPAERPFVGAAIVAVLLVGAVSSVQDAPRVAFQFWLLVLVAAHFRSAQLSTTGCAASLAAATDLSRADRSIGPADIVPPPRHPPHADPP